MAHADDHPAIMTYTDWKPVIYQDIDMQARGIFVDIMQHIFRQIGGQDIQFRQLPWSRAQAEVFSGMADMVITVPTEKRAKYVDYTPTPILDLYLHIYTRDDHPKRDAMARVTTIADLKKLDVDVVANLGNGWIKQNIEQNDMLVTYVGRDQNLPAVINAGRGDLFIDTPPTMNPIIRSMGLEGRVIDTGARFGPASFHLMVSKKSSWSRYLPQFEAVVATMKASGELVRIVDLPR